MRDAIQTLARYNDDNIRVDLEFKKVTNNSLRGDTYRVY